MNFNDRFNAAFPNMRGLTLGAPPTIPGIYQMQGNPAQYNAWRTNTPILQSPVDQPVPSAVPQPPAQVAAPRPTVPPTFPTSGAAPIANTPMGQGPMGLSLGSNPVQSWLSSIGLGDPSTITEKGIGDRIKDFFASNKESWDKALGGLEDIKKGFNPSASKDTGANTITPMSSGGHAGGEGGGMGGQLLAQLLANRRRNYGMTLTG